VNMWVDSQFSELGAEVSTVSSPIINSFVDFFLKWGPSEMELDRMRDVGALVNPDHIGSWISFSLIGGISGGWEFPVTMPVQIALESCDSATPKQDDTQKKCTKSCRPVARS